MYMFTSSSYNELWIFIVDLRESKLNMKVKTYISHYLIWYKLINELSFLLFLFVIYINAK